MNHIPRTTALLLVSLMVGTAGCMRSSDTEDASPQHAETGRIETRLAEFVDRLAASPLHPPGFAVVVVHRRQVIYADARGVRDLDNGAPMTLDTPIYIASTTKAMHGLYAALLDADGTVALDTTLADIWPEMTLPVSASPESITAASLLSHSSGIAAGGLVHRSNTTGDVEARDVPAHLSEYAVATRPGFSYSNFGPFVYSAMAEARTGVQWRDAMRNEVVDRIGLDRTSATLEDFPTEEIAHCHSRRGDRWVPVPHKPTAVLNAGGGIYSSANDIAAFLSLFVDPELSRRDSELARAARRTWVQEVEQDRVTWGLHRTGYGLGWDIGSYDGKVFVSRSGGYWGCRSIALFLPDFEFGVAALSVGDLATNSFNSAIVRQAIDIWTDGPDLTGRRLEEYARIATEEVARAAKRAREPVNSVSQSPTEVVELSGAYANDRLGVLLITASNGGLVVKSGVFVGDLRALGEDQFRLVYRGPDYSEHFEFLRRDDGMITGAIWDDDRYERIAE